LGVVIVPTVAQIPLRELAVLSPAKKFLLRSFRQIDSKNRDLTLHVAHLSFYIAPLLCEAARFVVK
jgi:hypothetical protein